MPAIVESRAMARRRLEGLERVLGVNALFSTAYGNVGSSIYYALGLVAALALGLTPVVFLLTGALFYCTATTYAEATAMFPEAGGSSLFVRRAFNEFWSFFTAWAQMLNYVITIAISAFFAAGYFGGVAGGWADGPEARVLLGVGADRRPRARQRARGQGRRGGQRRPRRRRLPQPARPRAAGRVPRPRLRRAQRQHRAVRHRADLAGLPHRHPDRHGGLHGHRDDLEHGRGGPRRGGDDPRRHQARDDRRLHDLLHAALGRALGPAGDAERGRRVRDAARRRLRGGRLRGQPDARHRHGDGARPGRPSSTSASSRSRSSSPPRTRASSACPASSTRWACTGRCPTGCGGCTRTSARPTSASSSSRRSRRSRSCRGRRSSSARSTRSARCSRSPWRTSRCCACASPSPGTSGPTGAPGACGSAATTCRRSPCSASRARRPRCSWSAPSTSRSRPRARPGCCSAWPPTSPIGAARGSTWSPPTEWRSPSRSSTTRPSTTPCSSTSATGASTRACSPRRSSSPPGAGAASTCS